MREEGGGMMMTMMMTMIMMMTMMTMMAVMMMMMNSILFLCSIQMHDIPDTMKTGAEHVDGQAERQRRKAGCVSGPLKLVQAGLAPAGPSRRRSVFWQILSAKSSSKAFAICSGGPDSMMLRSGKPWLKSWPELLGRDRLT